MMSKYKKTSCLLLMLSCFSASAVSADTWCEGTVNSLGIKKDGLVYVSGPGGLPVVYLCNVQNKDNGVEVESCKTMYSTLLAAQSQKRSVNITFAPKIAACSELESWNYAENVNWVIAQ